MNAPRSCVLYARKSTDREDKQILSIPAQLRELRDFASRSGLIITKELTESCSARKPGRPVFSTLLKDAQAGRVKRVLAWRLDRLARNPVDGGQLIYLLGEKVLDELVTTEGSYTGAGDSKFMLSVLFGAATKMTDDLAAGVRRGNGEVWRRGQITGRPPLGYMKTREGVGPKGTGRVVSDPERFPIVERAWKEMATGTRTVAEVWRKAVHEWGLRTRDTQCTNGRPPTETTLHNILRNPFYMGVIPTREGLFPGEHVAMITREEFERVQRLIRHEGAARPVRHVFAYAGLLRCGRCGRRLTGERIVKRSGLVFTYYRCGRRRQDQERCLAPAIPESAVTAAIEADLERLPLGEQTTRWLRDSLEVWASTRDAEVAERVHKLEGDLRQAEGDLERLTDVLVRGLLSDADYVVRRDQTRARITALEQVLAEPKAELEAWKAALSRALDDGVTLAAAFREGSTDDRRRLIARVYDNPVVSERIVKLALRFPFTLLDSARELCADAKRRDDNRAAAIDSLLNQNKIAHP